MQEPMHKSSNREVRTSQRRFVRDPAWTISSTTTLQNEWNLLGRKLMPQIRSRDASLVSYSAVIPHPDNGPCVSGVAYPCPSFPHGHHQIESMDRKLPKHLARAAKGRHPFSFCADGGERTMDEEDWGPEAIQTRSCAWSEGETDS